MIRVPGLFHSPRDGLNTPSDAGITGAARVVSIRRRCGPPALAWTLGINLRVRVEVIIETSPSLSVLCNVAIVDAGDLVPSKADIIRVNVSQSLPSGLTTMLPTGYL